MQYQDVDGGGILDLVAIATGDTTRKNASSAQPNCFLIEVNARPPGAVGTWATLYTYGIDTGALHLLRAINDGQRFAVLAHPFHSRHAHPGGDTAAQYWTVHCARRVLDRE